jgi:HSP20 family protein
MWKWEPFRDLLEMEKEMGRLFEKPFSLREIKGREWGDVDWIPFVDIYESENQVFIDVELPQMSSNQVDISVEDDILTISGERKYPDKMTDENCRRRERRYGKFKREIPLSERIDQENISAQFDKGVLHIKLGIKEEVKPKTIKIKVEEEE